MPVLSPKYSSTKAEILEYLSPDYSSTTARLLQYYGQITPVLRRSTAVSKKIPGRETPAGDDV